MENKRSTVLVLLIVLFNLSFGASSSIVDSQEVLSAVKKIKKDAVAVEQTIYADKGSAIYNDTGDVIAEYIYTNKAKGDKDLVPVVVVINDKKIIEGVELLPNKEPKNLLEKILESDFLNSWNGLTLKKAKTAKIDDIAGATNTTQAIIKEVKYSAKKIK